MNDERRAERDSEVGSELELGSELDSDATVVRPKPVAADPDETVVRRRPSQTPADVDAESDETVVVAPTVDVDATVVRARPAPVVNGPDHRGDPVPDPEHEADAAAQGAAAQETAAPVTAARRGILRRAANFMPRVYGPRPIATTVAPELVATAAGGVAATNPRAQLPSLARRDRRARQITLAGYAVSVCIACVGLWFIATLAFAG